MPTATTSRRASGKQRYKLTPYRRRHADSGVIAYANGRDYIVVQFNSGAAYLYTNRKAGRSRIKAMQHCAEAGTGLSGYISRHTHSSYTRELDVIGRYLVEG